MLKQYAGWPARPERHRHAVAWRHFGHRSADRFNNARALVTKDGGNGKTETALLRDDIGVT
jgi:hypothetical protein